MFYFNLAVYDLILTVVRKTVIDINVLYYKAISVHCNYNIHCASNVKRLIMHQ